MRCSKLQYEEKKNKMIGRQLIFFLFLVKILGIDCTFWRCGEKEKKKTQSKPDVTHSIPFQVFFLLI